MHGQWLLWLHFEFIRHTIFSLYVFTPVESVVFCSMSPLQVALYSHLTQAQLKRLHCRSNSNDMCQHLVCIGVLKKLCNSPSLLYTAARANSDSPDVSLYNHTFNVPNSLLLPHLVLPLYDVSHQLCVVVWASIVCRKAQ